MLNRCLAAFHAPHRRCDLDSHGRLRASCAIGKLEYDLSSYAEDRCRVHGLPIAEKAETCADLAFLSWPDDLDVRGHQQPPRESDVVVGFEPPLVSQEFQGGEGRLQSGVVDARVVVADAALIERPAFDRSLGADPDAEEVLHRYGVSRRGAEPSK